jgi:D-alanine-D-alanine ligase
LKIAVLMGGISEEREVSLASGVQVARALREAGNEVVCVDTGGGVLSGDQETTILDCGVRDPHPHNGATDLLRTGDLGFLEADPRLRGVQVIFLALHGGRGEDGTIQALLQLSGLPFVGSDRVGCALAMDKDLSKRLLRDAGIPTPDWVTARGREESEDLLPEIVQRLGLPLIVKPPSGGSTIGLSLAHDETELPAAIRLALQLEERVMFERYIRGREVTVGIVGEEPLPVGEIIPQHEIFDYECKYQPGMAEEIFPADLPAEVAARVQEKALAAHGALRLRDLSRVDSILAEDGTPWCLEANALPGMTGNSLVPKAAKAAGIPFPELCHGLAAMAFKRGGG